MRRPLAMLAAGLILTASCAPLHGPEPSPSAAVTVRPGAPVVAGGTVVAVDAATGDIRRVVQVGEDPLLIAAAGGQLWTLNSGDGTLSRIDPEKSESAATVTLDGEPPAAIASGGEDLWVAANATDLVRLDGLTGAEESRIVLGHDPLFRLRDAGFLTLAEGSIWLTIPVLGIASEPQVLWRVDADTGEVTARIPIERDPLPPVVYQGAIYVVSLDGRMHRVDMATNEAKVAEIGGSLLGAAGGSGSIWVGNELDRNVSRLDPRTLEVQATIDVGERVRGIAFGADRVWVATESSLLAIDPAAERAVMTIRLLERSRRDYGPIGLVGAGDTVWVSVE